jgi:hypothetical protein
MGSENELEDVTEKVKEYADLSKTIKITQEKLKILNKKKTELYKEVYPKLKNNNVTKCNLPYGTLKVVKSKRKVLPTKTSIKDKYISFFNTRAFDQDYILATPEQKADIIYKYLYVDNLEVKESHSISMTYSKDFKEQMKDMGNLMDS